MHPMATLIRDLLVDRALSAAKNTILTGGTAPATEKFKYHFYGTDDVLINSVVVEPGSEEQSE